MVYVPEALNFLLRLVLFLTVNPYFPQTQRQIGSYLRALQAAYVENPSGLNLHY